MAEVIRMPLLSDTMKEGKIVLWHKNVGDTVKSDDILADVETDKATMEVMPYVDGVLLHIGVPTGSAASVNEIIAIIGKSGEDISSLLNDNKSSTETTNVILEEKAEPIQTENKPSQITVEIPKDISVIRMPLLSDTMKEGKIISWLKNVGDVVKSDDILAEVETDKATMEVMGYADGTLLYQGVEAGKAAKINDVIAIVGKKDTDIHAFLPQLLNENINAEIKTEAVSEVKQEIVEAPKEIIVQPNTSARIF
ncbi:MAG: pyruvate dehydrogenase, partial [Chitinophagaceae bacterium]|nr:pyruvate dehydrogenase [Chitinophagaceae bacterium]